MGLALPACSTPAEIAETVDRIVSAGGPAEALVPLLEEHSPIYQGRGSASVEQVRGYVLAAFGRLGLPAGALPFVTEELESGRTPYVVAAAARALGGGVNAERAADLTLRAIHRLRTEDDLVSFEGFPPRPCGHANTTAVGEMIRVLAHLGPAGQAALRALRSQASSDGGLSNKAAVELAAALATPAVHRPISCCGEPAAVEGSDVEPAPIKTLANISHLQLEDQDGRWTRLDEALFGRRSALAFFYTRCMNPEKCSLTITKLGRLQRLLKDAGEHRRFKLAAITYDPDFDLAPRLKDYGRDRGFEFTPDAGLYRTPGGLDPLREALDLGVGFGPVTVNRHRVELYVVGPTGEVIKVFARALWSELEVLKALRG